MTPIKLAIADDHRLLRNSLAQMLRSQGFKIEIEADNGADLLDKLENTSIDVVLLDINMPVMDGYTTARNIRKTYPDIRILALSMYDDDSSVIGMLRAGVCGYLLKDTEPEELNNAIKVVHKKGFYYTELVTNERFNDVYSSIDSENAQLNEREIKFLQQACSDLTYKEIAGKLSLSPRTIDGYRDQLFKKLGLKSRTALVIYAIKEGIYKLD